MGKASRRKAIAKEAYEVLIQHFINVADIMTRSLPEQELEAFREEERNDPTYLETDAVIWNYAEKRFVPNTMHLKNEAKRFAAMDPVYSGKLKLCFKWLEVDR